MSYRFISPQEKKRLSLTKDRRNNYGESDKGSKKLIPLRKRLANKRVRRSNGLLTLVTRTESEQTETLEDRIKVKTVLRLKARWRKVPDTALGVVVKRNASFRRGPGHGARKRRNGKDALENT